MNRRFALGILLVIVLVVGAAAVGWSAYEMGVARGVAETARLANPDGGVVPVPYYGGPFFYRPWGFGCFGFLFPVLFIFLFFWLVRGFFWRGPWGWGRGPRGDWSKGTPPMFEEWHRRAHGEGSSEPAGSQPQQG